MVHYRPKSPTSAYKTYLYLQAKMGHKANQTQAAKPTASPLLAVQGMYKNRRTRTNTSISSNTLFTLLSVTAGDSFYLHGEKDRGDVQYVTTAAVAKEALEGHCIYDGGYCKLHLSFSRHTDLNVKAYSDKSRDYTIPDTGLLTNPQASAVPTASTSWQTNPQAAGTYVSSVGQTPAWDPSKTTFGSAAGTFPGQPFVPSAGAPYPTSGSLPTAAAGYPQVSQQMSHYGSQPRAGSGAPYVGQPPRYF
ncbi:hypothetical protein GW17_00044709 [Ensete ventricosum]|nr:hypothetical protein GW17_00044709 [Ensete ventricosum]